MSSGGTRYGISFSAGCAHPATPMPPRPTSLRKSLRLNVTESVMGFLVMTRQAIHRRRVLGVVEPLAMTLEAPSHLERRVLIHHVHLLNRAMAGLALDAGANVALVIELHVVRQPVDLDPRRRLTAVVIGRELLDLGPVDGGDLVAAHARAGGGNVGDRRF